jgi:dienelactone hydrolase
VEKINKPLLIWQVANDPRVKQAESDQIVKAMQAKNIPVTYVVYPDEGHGFARPQNRNLPRAVPGRWVRADRRRLQGRVDHLRARRTSRR